LNNAEEENKSVLKRKDELVSKVEELQKRIEEGEKDLKDLRKASDEKLNTLVTEKASEI
jgi:hypothetical protein